MRPYLATPFHPSQLSPLSHSHSLSVLLFALLCLCVFVPFRSPPIAFLSQRSLLLLLRWLISAAAVVKPSATRRPHTNNKHDTTTTTTTTKSFLPLSIHNYRVGLVVCSVVVSSPPAPGRLVVCVSDSAHAMQSDKKGEHTWDNKQQTDENKNGTQQKPCLCPNQPLNVVVWGWMLVVSTW